MTTSVSVVLATYEGEAFVAEQLASIFRQERRPDELLVADDGSTDATLSIVRSAIDREATRSGLSASVTVNERRLGPSASFARLITAARGDIVVLADQDDVWLPEKVAVLAHQLEADPTLLAAFSNASVIDEDGALQPGSLWTRVGLDRRRRRHLANGNTFAVLLQGTFVTGATLAIRRSLVERALPIPAGLPHDRWLACVAAAEGDVAAISRRLVRYRLHGANTAGLPAPGRLTRLAQRRAPVAPDGAEERFHRLLAERLDRDGVGTSRARRELDHKLEHLAFRGSLPTTASKRIPLVAAEALRGTYGRYASGTRSWAFDLVGPRRCGA